MKLIVYGNKSIEYYKTLIESTFKEMPRPQNPYNWRDVSQPPFNYFKEGRLTFYKTLNNHQHLEINLLIPDIFKSLPHNIALYFKVILNYKGKGSLRDVLIQKGLGSHVKATIRKTYDGWSLFKVGCFLTRKGINQLSRVLFLIFKYFEYMKQFSLNPRLYKFVKRYYDIKYLFLRRRIRAFTFVRNMCLAFQKYPIKYLFAQHRLLYLYDPKTIEEYGRYFVINNSLIMLGDKNFDSQLFSDYSSFLDNFNPHRILDNKEPWYKVDYSTYNLKSSFIDQLANDNRHPESFGFTRNFLFLKGYKLPKSIHLVRQCPRSHLRECLIEYRRDRYDLTPKVLEKNNLYELFHKQDRSYLISRLNFFNKFILPISLISPSNLALFKLFVVGFAHHFKNFFYSQRIRHNLFKIKLKSK